MVETLRPTLSVPLYHAAALTRNRVARFSPVLLHHHVVRHTSRSRLPCNRKSVSFALLPPSLLAPHPLNTECKAIRYFTALSAWMNRLWDRVGLVRTES